MRIEVINTGFFKLDGGAMFGIVPKRMWEKLNPPDENNMCTWAMRCLYVDTGKRKILMDTGIGNKQDAKFFSHFEPHGTDSLLGSLAALGVGPEEITDVLLTHLHFDHCGGAVTKNAAGELQLTFPNATHWTNLRHYMWANNPNDREKASFLKENWELLQKEKQLQFIDVRQNFAFDKDINIRFYNGHTEALMVPVIKTPQGCIVYCADTLPSRWHVPMPYVMAYDIRPLVTLQEKEEILKDALQNNHTLFFEHDPTVACCKLHYDKTKDRIMVGNTGNLTDFYQF